MSSTVEQREAARARANTVRFARATIRRELRTCPDKHAALRLCAEHLADPVSEIAAMVVYDLIAAGRGCGISVALKMLNEAGVSPGTKIGQPESAELGFLTPRQRADLIAALNVGPVLRGENPSRPKPTVRAVTPMIPVPVPVVRKPVLTPEPDTPGPSLSKWCPKCAEYALPMRDGTCGFCDTRIVAA